MIRGQNIPAENNINYNLRSLYNDSMMLTIVIIIHSDLVLEQALLIWIFHAKDIQGPKFSLLKFLIPFTSGWVINLKFYYM